jgi:tetratricopeptide (TPR) repeat protein
MRERSLWTLLVALAILTIARTGSAQTIDEQKDFEKGRYAYRTKNFDDAEHKFKAMLDPVTGTLHDKVLVTQARMYWGAALIATGHKPEALEQFGKILSVDPTFEPDPTVFPVEVGDAFIETRAGYQKRAIEKQEEERRLEKKRKEEDEAAKKAQIERLALLERLASQDHVLETNRRLFALVPGGVGQFQNGNKGLGLFFLSTEGLLALGTLGMVIDYYAQLHYAAEAYPPVTNTSIAQQYLDRANEARIADQIIFGALAATAIAGVIEAEVDFVPGFASVKPRALPPLPGTSPDAKPGAATAWPTLTFGAAPAFGAEGKGITGGVLEIHGRF